MRHPIKTLFLGFILTVTASCERSCCDYFDTQVNIRVVDEQGNNLLAKEITESDIDIYYLKDNRWIYQNSANLDQPEPFSFIMTSDTSMILALNNWDNESMTRIQWVGYSSDTIVSTYQDVNSNYVVVEDAWVIGQEALNEFFINHQLTIVKSLSSEKD